MPAQNKILSKDYQNFEAKVNSLLNSDVAKASDCKKVQKIQADFDKLVSVHPNETPNAALTMGRLFLHSKNLQIKDFAKAEDYFNMAYSLTSEDDIHVRSNALYNLGLIYIKNSAVQDFDKAFSFITQASTYDDIFLVGLGILYQYGLGVGQDERLAMECYSKSIKRGNDNYVDFYAAEYALWNREQGTLNYEAFNNFRRYLVEIFVNDNVQNGLPYLKKAADAGYSPALYDWATRYIDGSIKANESEVVNNADFYLKKAIDAGYIPAMYQYGYLWQIRADNKNAFKYFEMAAEKGYAPAQSAAGLCYYVGRGTTRDIKKAAMYLTAASEQGYTRLDRFRKAAIDEIEGWEEVRRNWEDVRQSWEEVKQSWPDAIDGIVGMISDSYDYIDNNATSNQQTPYYNNYSQFIADLPSYGGNDGGSSVYTFVGSFYATVISEGYGKSSSWRTSANIYQKGSSYYVKIGGTYYPLLDNSVSTYMGYSTNRANYSAIINNSVYFVRING